MEVMNKSDQQDYRDTVNLPKTAFPMRARLPKREPEMLEFWQNMDLYGKIRDARAGRPKYILHDGPPYANGEIHIGTAFNKVAKDIIVKYRTMHGDDAPFVPGWDCHGLPIEYRVMNDLGDALKDTSQLEIRQQCRAYASKYIPIMTSQFARLGVLGAWDNPYVTMSPEYEAQIIEVFGEMYRGGYVQRGLKPVYWCVECGTALAEAEVEYGDHSSPSVYVKFPATDAIPGLDGEVYYLIWTTTPWTLPANLATCLHPDLTYVGLKVGNETYVVAEGLLLATVADCGIDEYEVVGQFKGSDLEGLHYRHPLNDRVCPIILGPHVTLEQGTGCVHTAPGHGQEDYVIGLKYQLETFSPVADDGRFTEDAGEFAGQTVFAANGPIVDRLAELNVLLKSADYPHSYPHCWRCGTPVIFRATPQWFITMDSNGLRDNALEAVKTVRWVPDWAEERISSMIAMRPDWCISRQRAWGIPLPVLYCTDCGRELITDDTVTAIAGLARAGRLDDWFAEPVDKLIAPVPTCDCGGTSWDKETDILDVWFDSGVSHRTVLEHWPELRFPADLYIEGSDQHRGWFQSSLIPSVAVKGCAPYRAVITTGFTVDADGKKMSKSKGNAVDPQDIVDQYGSDILRLWAASTNYLQDMRISDEVMARVAEMYRSVRNTCRFALGNLYDFDPAADTVAFDDMLEIDRWILHRLEEVKQQVYDAYDQFEFHRACRVLYNFCVVDLSSLYFDILKDRLYTFAANSPDRRSAQSAISDILIELTQMFAPILPFTSEEIWQLMPAGLRPVDSVHLSEFRPVRTDRLDNELADRWAQLMAVRSEVSKALEELRGGKSIGSSLEARVHVDYAPGPVGKLLEEYRHELASLFIVSAVDIDPMPEDTDSPGELGITVTADRADGDKCIRCWNYSQTVGENEIHPSLCARCVDQLARMNQT